MSLQWIATYEDGVLKFDEPPPLQEHDRVTVTIEPRPTRASGSYGLIGWTGDTAALREIAENDESGVQESP